MEPIEHNEHTIICIRNKKFNEENFKRQHLYSNDSIHLIGLTQEDEIFGEEHIEIISEATNTKIAAK